MAGVECISCQRLPRSILLMERYPAEAGDPYPTIYNPITMGQIIAYVESRRVWQDLSRLVMLGKVECFHMAKPVE
jgi:hypothetical protein